MKKQMLIVCLLGSAFQLDAVGVNLTSIKKYPWNIASWCLVAGLGVKAYSARYNEDKELSFMPLAIAAISGYSAAKGLYNLGFPTVKRNDFVEVDSFAELIDELGYAIDSSEVALVEHLLTKFDQEELSLEMRRQILQSLSSNATKVLNVAKKKLSLLSSWRDVASTAIGAYLASSLFSINLDHVSPESNPLLDDKEIRKARLDLVRDSGFSFFGGYILYKGYTCGSQQWQLDDALAVRRLIEQHLDRLKDELN